MMIKFNPQILKAYFICGTQDLLPNTNLLSLVEQALKAGITAFQFRDKGANSQLNADQRLKMAQQLHQLCQDYQVPLIIDDDVRLAQQVHAEGIHVGQTDQNIQQVVDQVQDSMFIGLSCSKTAEILAANSIPQIAYYGCGPIYPTQSKADAAQVIRLSGLKKLVQVAVKPIVAIGGITENDLSAIIQTGAAGSSVISMIAQSSNVNVTVQKMINA
ncbi:thiamine phosphate synthase [Bombilactobacillus folatiphilus]|uniref:Thiamine-phosphate synthase n=1 Tax=Bombilactobacillus folatiphilus TaxID=2923362 RepID=A0ABY4P8W6_9LACO|nr:thiamine phosphate synthase [Bombilactobacillus folatiphilus]UQS82046.1 thiamine phosphate synthase [Bombilactobacillus folatiphilus]